MQAVCVSIELSVLDRGSVIRKYQRCREEMDEPGQNVRRNSLLGR